MDTIKRKLVVLNENNKKEIALIQNDINWELFKSEPYTLRPERENFYETELLYNRKEHIKKLKNIGVYVVINELKYLCVTQAYVKSGKIYTENELLQLLSNYFDKYTQIAVPFSVDLSQITPAWIRQKMNKYHLSNNDIASVTGVSMCENEQVITNSEYLSSVFYYFLTLENLQLFTQYNTTQPTEKDIITQKKPPIKIINPEATKQTTIYTMNNDCISVEEYKKIYNKQETKINIKDGYFNVYDFLSTPPNTKRKDVFVMREFVDKNSMTNLLNNVYIGEDYYFAANSGRFLQMPRPKADNLLTFRMLDIIKSEKDFKNNINPEFTYYKTADNWVNREYPIHRVAWIFNGTNIETICENVDFKAFYTLIYNAHKYNPFSDIPYTQLDILGNRQVINTKSLLASLKVFTAFGVKKISFHLTPQKILVIKTDVPNLTTSVNQYIHEEIIEKTDKHTQKIDIKYLIQE